MENQIIPFVFLLYTLALHQELGYITFLTANTK